MFVFEVRRPASKKIGGKTVKGELTEEQRQKIRGAVDLGSPLPIAHASD